MHEACRHVADRLNTESHVAALLAVYERILQEKQAAKERQAAMTFASASGKQPSQWLTPPARKAI
jgi:hypothetical protein